MCSPAPNAFLYSTGVIFTNLDNTVNYDFKGKLPFSWPSVYSDNPLNYEDQNYQPKYEYGFGLSYK